MKRKEMQRQSVLEAEDRDRMVAERADYADAVVGAPCPRCADIDRHRQEDIARGDPGGVMAQEGPCWLCHLTYRVVGP